MTEFLPCPFCGSAPVDRIKIDGFPMIFCAGEECLGPQTTARNFEDARKQWNRRGAPDPTRYWREMYYDLLKRVDAGMFATSPTSRAPVSRSDILEEAACIAENGPADKPTDEEEEIRESIAAQIRLRKLKGAGGIFAPS